MTIIWAVAAIVVALLGGYGIIVANLPKRDFSGRAPDFKSRSGTDEAD